MVVLITGGSGTFGTACTAELLARGDSVIIFSRDELKQSELRRQFPSDRLECFIGDVRDREAVFDACQRPGIDLVIHAAALKQVATGENFPKEVHKTNVGGALNVIAAALEFNIPRVVALSTDKAVCPLNVYGKSKAEAEGLFIAANATAARAHRQTQFTVVRYGNVIGSRGSFVPLLVGQRDRGELRITHLDASRFWMRIEQAVEVVLKATEMPAGSILVPKIPSARVLDVAQAVAPDARVTVTGLTLGEKLHEQLIAPAEAAATYDLGQYYLIAPVGQQWPWTLPDGAVLVPADFRYSSELSPSPVTFEEPVH